MIFCWRSIDTSSLALAGMVVDLRMDSCSRRVSSALRVESDESRLSMPLIMFWRRGIMPASIWRTAGLSALEPRTRRSRWSIISL